MWRRTIRYRCHHCNNPCKFRCDGCRTAFYCNKKHQRLHWDKHKRKCKSLQKLQIEREFTSEGTRRRVLVAHADFKKGDEIFVEKIILKSPETSLKVPQKNPVSVGGTSSCIVCNALMKITSNCDNSGENECFPHCSRCKWPICGEKCLKFHRLLECRILKYCPFPPENLFSSQMPPWKFVFFLRVLGYERNNPRSFRALLSLDIAPEIDNYYEQTITGRNKSPVTIPVPQLATVYDNCMLEFLKILAHYNQTLLIKETEKVRRVIEIVDWNSFPINLPSGDNKKPRKFYGLYHLSTAAKQCCIPNAILIPNPTSNFQSVCVASIDIKKGDVIKFCKNPDSKHILKDNYARDARLASLHSDCTCRRCTDPTEFGSYLGSIKCINFKGVDQKGCKVGNLLPNWKHQKDNVSGRILKIWEWKCDCCGVERSQNSVHLVVQKLKVFSSRAITSADSAVKKTPQKDFGLNLTLGNPVAAFIHKVENVMLHQNHWILFKMKMVLLGLYSDAVERLFNLGKHRHVASQIISAAMFMFTISEKLLRILDKISPGLSIERAKLYYYKQEAFILLAPKVLINLRNTREKANFRAKLEEVTSERRDAYLIFHQYSFAHTSYEEKIEWMKIHGNLYKLLRKKYGNLFEKKSTGAVFKFGNGFDNALDDDHDGMQGSFWDNVL